MKKSVCLLATISMVVSLQSSFAADITGKVKLTGKKPPEERVIEDLKKDASCGKTRTDTPKTRLYVVGAGGELADVFVYIKEGLKEKKTDPSAKPVVLDQIGCEYVPYVFGIQTKQQLVIKNSDPMMHNINMNSKAGNKSFNEAQMGKAPDKTKVFDNPEFFMPFQCNVHPWMFAYGSVVDHPYFAVTDKDGSFKLVNVPAGKYVVEAWHRKAGKASQEVTVENDGKTADFVLELK